MAETKQDPQKTHVALAGATGVLGPHILAALLQNPSYTVTLLTRADSQSTAQLPASLTSNPRVSIARVDFTSAASIGRALSDDNIAVVISCVATAAIPAQKPLIDAAVAAGVRRFVPAEFGLDSANEKARALPVIAIKAVIQDYLNAKAAESRGAFSWTAIANGYFLDWVLAETKLMLDIEGRTATLYNGGDVKTSGTLLRDIAAAVVGIVERRDDRETRDRVVYVHSTVVTQKQLIGYAEEKDGRVWKTSMKGTDELLEEIEEAVRNGDWDTVYSGSVLVGCGDAEYGCDFSRQVDNNLLGIQEMDEAEVKNLIWGLM